MKELFYQLYFMEREDPHNPVIKFSIPDKRDYKLIDFISELRIAFEVGYDPDEVDDRDQWAETTLGEMCVKFNCEWEYLPIAGTLIVD